jgi:mRNA interferase MazF
MEKPVAGEVVIIPFPQTDLTAGKRRPALVLVSLKGDDLILSQITSKARFDGYSIVLNASDFQTGSLQVDSFVRPQRLFTVDRNVIIRSVGRVKQEKLEQVLTATATLFVSTKKTSQQERETT